MTRDEAKGWLKAIKDKYIHGGDEEFDEKRKEAVDMAIKALEQEPKSEWQHDHEILKAYSDGASAVLDKVRAEIDAARFIDKDTKHCKNANASGLEVALDIIDKYKAESEIHCTWTDSEIAKSFIEDVEAVKDLLPRAEGSDKE